MYHDFGWVGPSAGVFWGDGLEEGSAPGMMMGGYVSSFFGVVLWDVLQGPRRVLFWECAGAVWAVGDSCCDV